MTRRRTAPARPVHPFAAEAGVNDWRGDPICRRGQPLDPACLAFDARRKRLERAA